MGQYKKHEITGPMFAGLERGDVDFGGVASLITPLRLDKGALASQYYPFRLNEKIHYYLTRMTLH